jgi:hypothetical protein
MVHSRPNDAPNGCDTWHFKKGVVGIHIDGREDDSHLAWLEVSPANPAQPLGDARGERTGAEGAAVRRRPLRAQARRGSSHWVWKVPSRSMRS